MFVLSVVEGPDRGKQLRLEPGEIYSVGTGEDDALALTDPKALEGHCTVELSDGRVLVTNMTASAGTFVGEKKIARAKLPARSAFRVGDTTIAVREAARRPSPSREVGDTTAGGRRPAREDDPLVGKILGGYKIKEVVGRGGMGTVYRATQLSLHRDVAVKVLASKLARDESFRELFINEARAAAQLVDPNIVQVYDAGSEGDHSFFSMEFIGQGSVEEILERDGKIDWQQAILMVLEAAHGLKYAENKGIVHRDIKPDNLMINDDGRVKIADLGLAKRGEAKGDQGIIGTPHFIPPEQAKGEEVDSRADIYSLGATFFRMITGKTLFTGKTAKEIVLKHVREAPPAASSVDSGIPDDLDLVLAKMLAKNPDDRYQSCDELIGALEEVCAHHGIKGSIIKKGVGKRVMIPLVVVLLAAIGFAGYLVTKPPEKDIDSIEKAKEAERRKKLAEARAKEAEREREIANLKARAQNEYIKLTDKESELERRVSRLDDVYDDPNAAEFREGQWREMASRYREYAESEENRKYGDDYVSKALERAKYIEKRLEDLKATKEDRARWIAEQVAAAKKIDSDSRDLYSRLITDHRYEDAYTLCQRIADGKGPQDPRDPFAEVLKAEWESPIPGMAGIRAVNNKRILEVVGKSRVFFSQQSSQVKRNAESDWNKRKKTIEELVESGREEDLVKAIAILENVIDQYPTEDPKGIHLKEVQDILVNARNRKETLEKKVRQIRLQRLAEDRARVRETLRRHSTLNPDALNNLVMNLQLADARTRFADLETQLETERYRAFAAERRQMVAWMEYLFARFRVDVRATEAAGRGAGPLETLEIHMPHKDDPGKTDRGRLEEPPRSAYEFNVKIRLRTHEKRLAAFPMDWVYHRYFLHEGKLRWKEVEPVVRFALGAFCYETFQFDEAKEHFDLLLDDPRYGEIAQVLAGRCERERAAMKEFRELTSAVAVPLPEEPDDIQGLTKRIEQLEMLRKRVQDFGERHGDTRVFLDIMPSRMKVPASFYDVPMGEGGPKLPAIPDAPPLPD